MSNDDETVLEGGPVFSTDRVSESILDCTQRVAVAPDGRLTVSGRVHFEPVREGSLKLPDGCEGHLMVDATFEFTVPSPLEYVTQVQYRYDPDDHVSESDLNLGPVG